MNFRIVFFDSVSSTNDLAHEWARSGVREGAVICADYQRKGRGRFKRRWFSKRGRDLLLTILLRPKMKINRTAELTQIAAQAVREVLRSQYGVPAAIKRPNDILVDGKKICGILTEAASTGSRCEYLLVGIGLNVNSRGKELLLRATSLARALGREVDRRVMLDEILHAFNIRYRRFTM
jgi:BirA family transcriptional regulator, biotin operon repressor / biotin---[acetyl-CoA-carboxylase] ligase